MSVIEKIKAKAAADLKHIVLAEGTEPRTVQAAQKIVEQKLANVTLVGAKAEVEAKAAELGVDLTGVGVVDPAACEKTPVYAQKLFELRQKKGMTLDQLLTLASIIQAEAANKDDMYNVSSVLNNRLQYGDQYDIFHLDCDSTTYYPYRNKDAVPADKRETYKSTYDTYTIEGLPAGPICNPGLDAIDAALNPNDTAYFYFCHNPETGEAYYAETPAGHEANLEKAGLK